MTRIDTNDLKCDRVLALREKGLSNQQIAERVGCTVRQVPTFVKVALQRRERKMAEA